MCANPVGVRHLKKSLPVSVARPSARLLLEHKRYGCIHVQMSVALLGIFRGRICRAGMYVNRGGVIKHGLFLFAFKSFGMNLP